MAIVHFTHCLDLGVQLRLWGLKCYVDDMFSIGRVGDVSWYVPYAKEIPTGQVWVFKLWDEIHLPHVEKKQISVVAISILGCKVNLNRMTVYLSFEKCQYLVECVGKFLCKMSKLLHE